jgi:hypothetical protein
MFFPTRSVIVLALIAVILFSAPLSNAAGPTFSVSFPKSRNEKPLDGRIFLLLSTDPFRRTAHADRRLRSHPDDVRDGR